MNFDISNTLAMSLTVFQRQGGWNEVRVPSHLPKGPFFWELIAIRMAGYGTPAGVDLAVFGSETFRIAVPDLAKAKA